VVFAGKIHLFPHGLPKLIHLGHQGILLLEGLSFLIAAQ
jgi:hypothetical protein